ncbi:hypothetical protein KAI87_05720 [Myxococcota bacterium]|nr:hypothetical protein [Myxococcota bacterium]
MSPVISASAPAKLLLLGEYAVLNGAPALVAAVDKRVKLSFEYSQKEPLDSNRIIRVEAPQIGVSGVEFFVGEHDVGFASFVDQEKRDALELLRQLLRELLSTGLKIPGGTLHIDSSALFDAEGNKLGLGSSAALSVAALGCLSHAAGADLDVHEIALLARKVHTLAQGGKGSGVDIAAAAYGGALCYEAADFSVTPVAWPEGLFMRAWFSGRSASTKDFVARVAAAQNKDEQSFKTLEQELAIQAGRGVDFFSRGEVSGFISLARDYADALYELGQLADVSIINSSEKEWMKIAADMDVALKPSGAGGGDMWIAFGEDTNILKTLDDSAAEFGFVSVELALSSEGWGIDNG